MLCRIILENTVLVLNNDSVLLHIVAINGGTNGYYMLDAYLFQWY